MERVLFRNVQLLQASHNDSLTNAVLIDGPRVEWIGSTREIPDTNIDKVIECDGATLMRGLRDAHMHFLAYAASLTDLDCQGADSIAALQRLIQHRAVTTQNGIWVRGRGYDEFRLDERRHPTRYDLDIGALDTPVRLDHRSGHACVLNSEGLERVGVGPNTPDPPEGFIERDEAGTPTGLLIELNSYVSERMGERRDEIAMRHAISQASQNLLSWGVTSFEDASIDNSITRWEALLHYQVEGLVQQSITLMPGIQNLEEFARKGTAYGSVGSIFDRRTTSLLHSREHSSLGGAGQKITTVRLGHAKIVVTLTTGSLYPPTETLMEMIMTAHRLGFPVAVHAVEEEVILSVLEVVRQCQLNEPQHLVVNDRVEHCSEATPPVLAMLKETGVVVCTNPQFLHVSGERYRSEVPPEVLPWLYPLRSLLQTGNRILVGSDAPVVSPDPWQGIYAAVTRKDMTGETLSPEQSVSLEQALLLYQSPRDDQGPSQRKPQEPAEGDQIVVGDEANLVVLDRDVMVEDRRQILGTRAIVNLAARDW